MIVLLKTALIASSLACKTSTEAEQTVYDTLLTVHSYYLAIIGLTVVKAVFVNPDTLTPDDRVKLSLELIESMRQHLFYQKEVPESKDQSTQTRDIIDKFDTSVIAYNGITVPKDVAVAVTRQRGATAMPFSETIRVPRLDLNTKREYDDDSRPVPPTPPELPEFMHYRTLNEVSLQRKQENHKPKPLSTKYETCQTFTASPASVATLASPANRQARTRTRKPTIF